jgi:hypothetical protein
MNTKSTWVWIVIAAGLLGAIFVESQLRRPPAPPPTIVPPAFAEAVRSVLVRPAGQDEIRADLTTNNI